MVEQYSSKVSILVRVQTRIIMLLILRSNKKGKEDIIGCVLFSFCFCFLIFLINKKTAKTNIKGREKAKFLLFYLKKTIKEDKYFEDGEKTTIRILIALL